jgi:hypothetical protein
LKNRLIIAGVLLALAGAAGLVLRGLPAAHVVASPPAARQPMVSDNPPVDRPRAIPGTSTPAPAPTSPRVSVAAPAAGEVDWTRVCRPPPETLPPPAELHRWRDAAGRRVFSDRPPQGAAADHVALALPADATSVVIEALGGDVPPGLASEIGADLRLLVGQLAGYAGVRLDRHVRLNILLLYGDAVYGGIGGADAAALAASDGMYRAAERMVVVRGTLEPPRLRRVLRHEAVHALLHEAIGPVPLWLNEGLAELLETGAAGDPDPGKDWRRVLAALPAPERIAVIGAVLDMPHAEFQGPARLRHYAAAWALVQALATDAAGQRTLAALLAAQARQPGCAPIDAIGLLDVSYPGGAAALVAAAARVAG